MYVDGVARTDSQLPDIRSSNVKSTLDGQASLNNGQVVTDYAALWPPTHVLRLEIGEGTAQVTQTRRLLHARSPLKLSMSSPR